MDEPTADPKRLIVFRDTPAQQARLEALAELHGTTVSDELRKALAEHLDRVDLNHQLRGALT